MAVKTRTEPMAARAEPMAQRRVAHPSVEDRRAAGSRRGTGRRCLATAAGRRPATGPTRSRCWRTRMSPGSPTWSRSGTGGCWSRRSPSTGARPRSWPPTWPAPPPPAWTPSCAVMPICRTGAFASPERRLLFGLNDFDETLPGPFEYDVKRMAASFTIAGRNNGFAKADTQAATLEAARAYREAMAGFAAMGTMDIWYAHLDEDELKKAVQSAAAGLQDQEGSQDGQAGRRRPEVLAKAHTRDSLQALSKLGEVVDGRYRIVSQPPIVVPAGAGGHLRPVGRRGRTRHPQAVPRLPGHPPQRSAPATGAVPDRGCGPQGGRGGQRRHPGLHRPAPGPRPARPAVPAGQGGNRLGAEGPLGKAYRQHGERVVDGQRMMQAASDIYLGWTKPAEVNRHFYWRQLRDMKGSAEVESMVPVALSFYAGICGWTLARAHAAPATRSRSPPTWARATPSTGRSPTSPSATPTRTSATTRHSPRQSAPAAWKQPKASEGGGGQPSSDHDKGGIVDDAGSLGSPAQPATHRRRSCSSGSAVCWGSPACCWSAPRSFRRPGGE